ncbi:hypothetical protein ACKZDW_06310 (plasmid) [Ralstonia syzygii subsp. celebesensis]
MKSAEVRLYIYHRASQDETVEERHGIVMDGLKEFGGPLGLNQVPIPSIPDFDDGLYAGYSIKPPLYRGLRLVVGIIIVAAKMFLKIGPRTMKVLYIDSRHQINW